MEKVPREVPDGVGEVVPWSKQCHPCSSSILSGNWAALWHRGTATPPHCRAPSVCPHLRAAPVGCSHSTGAEWLRPSGHPPHHRDSDSSLRVASAGAEQRVCDGAVAGPVWNSASVSHIKPVLQHSQFQ